MKKEERRIMRRIMDVFIIITFGISVISDNKVIMGMWSQY